MAALMQRPGMSGPAENDIYTVLLIIATIFIVVATGLLIYQFGAFYGLDNLFHGPVPIGQ